MSTIPPHTVHAWAVLDALIEDAARLCRAPASLVRDPGRIDPKAEPAAFRARRIVAWVLRSFGASQQTIGTMLDRDHSTIRHSLNVLESSPWERQAAEQLAAKWAPRDVAS